MPLESYFRLWVAQEQPIGSSGLYVTSAIGEIKYACFDNTDTCPALVWSQNQTKYNI